LESNSAREIWDNEITLLAPALAGVKYHRLEDGGLQWPAPHLDHPGTAVLHQDGSFTSRVGRFMPVDRTPPGKMLREAYLFDQFKEVFGFKVPTYIYLHRGHTWVVLEDGGRVRIGMDDFSQKLLGPGDKIRLPEIGSAIRHDEAALALFRRGEKAGVLAPLSGVVEAVNSRLLARPDLVHDDPYGEGWLMVVNPTNLKPDLDNLLFDRGNAAWIEDESLRLLAMLEPSVGATLQSGGTIVDDVYGHYPQLGWARLVKEFLRSA
jgi:glycine cleavage system H lipoate-binding protein